MKNILDFWALNGKNPREAQLKVFDWISQQDKKYIILESPVGSGKSPIAMTYSGFLTQNRGSSYILTPQRILQEQYEKSFRREILYSLYGKSNYDCQPKNTNCSIGSNIRPKCEYCPNRIALQDSIHSPNLVLNYKLALLHFANTPFFEKRNLIILDECHALEKELIDFSTLDISKYWCKKNNIKFTSFKKIEDAFNWFKNYYVGKIYEAYEELIQECENILDKENMAPSTLNIFKEIEELSRHLKIVDMINILTIDEIKEKYILVYDNNEIFFQFKKLYANDEFLKILDPKADKFLFMSATIINHKSYCKDLGIDYDNSSFLSIDSEFEPKNRPVYFAPVMKMNAKWKDSENTSKRIEMIENIISILNSHKDHSGIIHSGNFEITKWLVKELTNKISHKIFHHIPSDVDKEENIDRNDSINNFIECNKPSILISPSITEGLDLKDDLSRFAIFVKIPFGYLGDQWIKARMDISNEWYQRKALIDVLQGCGRIVRTTEDWGNVYILDQSWEYLFNNNISKIPKWWLDSYIELYD